MPRRSADADEPYGPEWNAQKVEAEILFNFEWQRHRSECRTPHVGPMTLANHTACMSAMADLQPVLEDGKWRVQRKPASSSDSEDAEDAGKPAAVEFYRPVGSERWIEVPGSREQCALERQEFYRRRRMQLQSRRRRVIPRKKKPARIPDNEKVYYTKDVK